MPRTLILCFLHGFKGNDNTFRTFPEDLKDRVREQLSKEDGEDTVVESIVYPRYETKGELGQCSAAFLEWLKERVMEVRKARCERPWPPNDRDVGVILVAHSMGGFVASDTLFLILNEKLAQDENKKKANTDGDGVDAKVTREEEDEGEGDEEKAEVALSSSPMFPLIQGILTFDTPFNGLARPMFVYGAFSNYQKVSSVFNVMTALSAAPAALGKTAFKRAVVGLPSRAATGAGSSRGSPAWKAWQLVAVRTGTVGAIAAGGVAAYMHRQQIMDGMRSMRNLNKESVKEGYQQGLDSISQGLAYINRGNVGRSFEYLSDHFTFVGALLKQRELSQRLERMALLKGVGIHDYYTSLGENGMWSGGYFVPERTFCAIPSKDHQAYHLFSRRILKKVDDEVQAHMSMFIRDKNDEYEQMTQEASNLVVRWFRDDSPIVDHPKFAEPVPEPIEQPVTTTQDGQEVPKIDVDTDGEGSEVPDESPLDITAAAAALPLPDDEDEEEGQDEHSLGTNTKEAQKSNYMRHLMKIAQQAGTGVKSYVPTKMPEMPSGPSFKSFVPRQMPSMPVIPQMPSIPGPGLGLFGKKNEGNNDDQKSAQSTADSDSLSNAAATGAEEPSDHSEVQQPSPDAAHQEAQTQQSPSVTVT
ncbi:hypothetical protein F5Y17DRAFT_466029 [Xylariaceae sp. FL0594]|nr:hypothetical protein F5Y17DRAFT_466029 [Xylariaceae sp. FL0594]